MRYFKLSIQYIGSAYVGWQVQAKGQSIQGLLQEILSEILHEKISLQAAGRTDSGVHALGQIAHFKSRFPIDLSILQRALNARLPAHICVSQIEEVSAEFHAQRDAREKIYTYLILNSLHPVPFLSLYTWRIYGNLDLEAMRACLSQLEGTHDFSAFRAADSTAKTSTRTLYAVSLERVALCDLARQFGTLLGIAPWIFSAQGDARAFGLAPASSLIAISLRGQGFLKHMVRNIVGTVVQVGLRKMPVQRFGEVFSSRDRRQAGMTAPARGLFLVNVRYGSD